MHTHEIINSKIGARALFASRTRWPTPLIPITEKQAGSLSEFEFEVSQGYTVRPSLKTNYICVHTHIYNYILSLSHYKLKLLFLGQDLGTYAEDNSGDRRKGFQALLGLTALYFLQGSFLEGVEK